VAPIALWLFVVALGLRVRAGIYESRIVVPLWARGVPGTLAPGNPYGVDRAGSSELYRVVCGASRAQSHVMAWYAAKGSAASAWCRAVPTPHSQGSIFWAAQSV